jgi:hypothetical protein
MKDNKHMFWVSYSDLMTSLFFIMLVLFIVTVGYLKIKQKDLVRATEELGRAKDSLLVSNQEKDQLLNLDKQFERLTENDNFKQIGEKYYYEELMGKEIFVSEKTTFHPDFDISIIDETGRKIEAFLQTLDPSMKYFLIIEGNAARKTNDPQSTPIDSPYGYELSYQRALTIYERWLSQGINLRKKNVEVLICGSGFNGTSRDKVNEGNNKRIVIQIIPKVLYNKIEKNN